jgi:hypothetical protein
LENLAIAHDRLSFMGGPPPAIKDPVGTVSKQIPLGATIPAPPPKKMSAGATADTAVYWYVHLKEKTGKPIVRKLTTAQVEALIKNKIANADTPVSKTREGSPRSLGTYGEFLSFFKTANVQDRADKGADRFKSLVADIDKQYQRQQRWRWFKNLFGSSSKMVVGIIWILVVLAIVGGAIFFGKKYFFDGDSAKPDPKAKATKTGK